jgi:hypothetical protein
VIQVLDLERECVNRMSNLSKFRLLRHAAYRVGISQPKQSEIPGSRSVSIVKTPEQSELAKCSIEAGFIRTKQER